VDSVAGIMMELRQLSHLARGRDQQVDVPNFNALPAFIEGTDLITTQLSLMIHGPLKVLDWVPLPVETMPLGLHLVWHQKDDIDPAHQWLRQEIMKTINSIVAKYPESHIGALKN
jgi:DNA-binding transcriptional LysR family regulator